MGLTQHVYQHDVGVKLYEGRWKWFIMLDIWAQIEDRALCVLPSVTEGAQYMTLY